MDEYEPLDGERQRGVHRARLEDVDGHRDGVQVHLAHRVGLWQELAQLLGHKGEQRAQVAHSQHAQICVRRFVELVRAEQHEQVDDVEQYADGDDNVVERIEHVECLLHGLARRSVGVHVRQAAVGGVNVSACRRRHGDGAAGGNGGCDGGGGGRDVIDER